jgi:hypothetical protein
VGDGFIDYHSGQGTRRGPTPARSIKQI